MTHGKRKYAVIIGNNIDFFARPEPTKHKKYREPVLVAKRQYKLPFFAIMAKLLYELT